MDDGIPSTFSYEFFFTDIYQIKMAYGYWRSKKANDDAVFAAFFRKNPFNGQFTIFSGLSHVIGYLKSFKITESDIEFMKKMMHSELEEGFIDYIKNLDFSKIEIQAFDEGSVVFPNEPLLQIRGPLLILQLLETPLLNFINFGSLVATNASHFRLIAGPNVKLSEFGCRRAQGPDGAMSASLYAYIGGFDSTSNGLACKVFGIPPSGTMAHSFVSSFSENFQNEFSYILKDQDGKEHDILIIAREKIKVVEEILGTTSRDRSESELEAFAAFASSYPTQFTAVIDTYRILTSGIINFCAVALALSDLGYKASGIRIDSGDLLYFSSFCRQYLVEIAEKCELPWFSKISIIVSNEINLPSLAGICQHEHSIDIFGIGTNLVTCQMQTSLGMVYKLVEINGEPRIKLSEDSAKMTIPFKKSVYRLYENQTTAIVDLITLHDEPPPIPGSKVICHHPYIDKIMVYITPTRVEKVLKDVWKNGSVISRRPSITEIKENVKTSLDSLRSDYKRLTNASVYKVSISDNLYNKFAQIKGGFPVHEIGSNTETS